MTAAGVAVCLHEDWHDVQLETNRTVSGGLFDFYRDRLR